MFVPLVIYHKGILSRPMFYISSYLERAAFEELKRKVKPEIDWLSETGCDRCGGKATTAYTVYSQVFQCPRCMEKVALFDCSLVVKKTYRRESTVVLSVVRLQIGTAMQP